MMEEDAPSPIGNPSHGEREGSILSPIIDSHGEPMLSSPFDVLSASNLLTPPLPGNDAASPPLVVVERMGLTALRMRDRGPRTISSSSSSDADIGVASTHSLSATQQQAHLPSESGDEEENVAEEEKDDDDQSVRSIERVLSSQGTSFVHPTDKRERGGRWDTNLMEESMPGLVSFCHGSFASQSPQNGSSFLRLDEESVSSLECSLLLNSQHSQPPPPPSQHQEGIGTPASASNRSALYGSIHEEETVLLEPCLEKMKTNHQEGRWSMGSIHQSSDTLPAFSRRRSGRHVT